jgi:transposase-like protein
MIRSSDPKFALRHELATCAIKKGIKAAARCYECSRNTVRKWVRRFALNRNQGLFPVSRAPHCCPHKTPPALEAKCVAKPKHSPGFGSRRLIAEFDLKIGHNALDRIFPRVPTDPPTQAPPQT